MKARSLFFFDVCGAVVLVVLALAFSTHCAVAESGKKSELVSDKDLPKTGSLAASSMLGTGPASFADPFGGEDPSGREKSPITGSVSRVTADKWEIKIFNNSKDSYSVSVDLIQRDLRSTEIRRDSYSYTLKPESSKSERIAVGVGAQTAELTLRHWSNRTKKVKAK
jgi:hypothetical protein